MPRTKTHFVIVDAVGVVEQEKVDTQTLERKRTRAVRQAAGSRWPGARATRTR